MLSLPVIHATTKKYLIPLILGSLVALTGFILTIVYVDPYSTGLLGHLFFYTTLFLSIIGLSTISSLIFRQKFFPGIYAGLFQVSLRQAILIASLITGLVFLEAQNVLYWWVGLTLGLFLIAIESFFSAN